MSDSIDLVKGVSLAGGYLFIGGVVGALVDGVITMFTETSDGQSYEHRDIRGVFQALFSLFTFGQVVELVGPSNIDSPFALTVGTIMLFATQPHMMADLVLMFSEIEHSLFAKSRLRSLNPALAPVRSSVAPLQPAVSDPPLTPLNPQAGVASSVGIRSSVQPPAESMKAPTPASVPVPKLLAARVPMKL